MTFICFRNILPSIIALIVITMIICQFFYCCWSWKIDNDESQWRSPPPSKYRKPLTKPWAHLCAKILDPEYSDRYTDQNFDTLLLSITNLGTETIVIFDSHHKYYVPRQSITESMLELPAKFFSWDTQELAPIWPHIDEHDLGYLRTIHLFHLDDQDFNHDGERSNPKLAALLATDWNEYRCTIFENPNQDRRAHTHHRSSMTANCTVTETKNANCCDDDYNEYGEDEPKSTIFNYALIRNIMITSKDLHNSQQTQQKEQESLIAGFIIHRDPWQKKSQQYGYSRYVIYDLLLNRKWPHWPRIVHGAARTSSSATASPYMLHIELSTNSRELLLVYNPPPNGDDGDFNQTNDDTIISEEEKKKMNKKEENEKVDDKKEEEEEDEEEKEEEEEEEDEEEEKEKEYHTRLKNRQLFQKVPRGFMLGSTMILFDTARRCVYVLPNITFRLDDHMNDIIRRHHNHDHRKRRRSSPIEIRLERRNIPFERYFRCPAKYYQHSIRYMRQNNLGNNFDYNHSLYHYRSMNSQSMLETNRCDRRLVILAQQNRPRSKVLVSVNVFILLLFAMLTLYVIRYSWGKPCCAIIFGTSKRGHHHRHRRAYKRKQSTTSVLDKNIEKFEKQNSLSTTATNVISDNSSKDVAAAAAAASISTDDLTNLSKENILKKVDQSTKIDQMRKLSSTPSLSSLSSLLSPINTANYNDFDETIDENDLIDFKRKLFY